MKITLTAEQKQALLKSIKEDCHTSKIGLNKEVDTQADKIDSNLTSTSVKAIKTLAEQELITDELKQQLQLAKEVSKFCNEKAFKDNTIDLSEAKIKQICAYLDKDITNLQQTKEKTTNILKKYFEPFINSMLETQLENQEISEQEKQEIKQEAIAAAIKKGLSSPDQKANLQKLDNLVKRDLAIKSVFEKALKSASKIR